MRNCFDSQMKLLGRLAGLICCVALLSGCQQVEHLWPFSKKKSEDLLVRTESEAGVENAQKGLDYFMLCLRKKRGDAFYAKVRYATAPNKEAILWLGGVKRLDSDLLKGSPVQIVDGGVKNLGQNEREFRRRQILDWVIIHNGVSYGGFTEPAYRALAKGN